MNGATTMTDRRRHRRAAGAIRGEVRGEIADRNGPTGLACRIHDFSFRGASLVFADAAVVPDEPTFEILISDERWRFRATRIWSRDGRIGVRLEPLRAEPQG
jgi:hypothetical protein